MYYVAGSPGRVFLYTVFTETWIIEYDSSDQSFQLFFYSRGVATTDGSAVWFGTDFTPHASADADPFIREWDQEVH